MKQILKPLLFLVLILVLAAGVYLVLKRNSSQSATTSNITPAPSNGPTTPTPELNADKVVRITDPSGKNAAFSITYNNSWTVSADGHSFTKGDYRVSFPVSQVTDAECIFSGTAGQGQLDAHNFKYTELQNSFGKFRYFLTGHDNVSSFVEFCGPGAGKPDNKFFVVTKIGVVGYALPFSSSPLILAEMDKMIRSIVP